MNRMKRCINDLAQNLKSLAISSDYSIKPFISLFLHLFPMSKPTEPYDPQTLDHYESFHKEIDRNGYLHIAGYATVFAPFGWFIGMLENSLING